MLKTLTFFLSRFQSQSIFLRYCSPHVCLLTNPSTKSQFPFFGLRAVTKTSWVCLSVSEWSRSWVKLSLVKDSQGQGVQREAGEGAPSIGALSSLSRNSPNHEFCEGRHISRVMHKHIANNVFLPCGPVMRLSSISSTLILP